MITKEQVKILSKKFKINEYVITREYFQLLFLKELYSENFSQEVCFKGGTAIRIVYDGKRFSEDLDFTVNLKSSVFIKHLNTLFGKLERKYPVSFKERKTITGKTYLMSARLPDFKEKIFIRLDFSLRNDVVLPITQTIINRGYPIIFNSFINCLSKDEIFAEKIRAFLNRDKYRDLYDLWMLLELGAKVDLNQINQKLKLYHETFEPKAFAKRLDSIEKIKFIQDLRPLVPIDQRDKLDQLLIYIIQYLKSAFYPLPTIR